MQRTSELVRASELAPVGQRGKRLRPGDRQQEHTSHTLPCVCGCNAHQQSGVDGIPGKGLISRAHLESRAYEETRNEDWNNLPACLHLNHWLDLEATRRPDGEETCKEVLRRLAREVVRRLTPEEVQPILEAHGYYTWLADRHNQVR